MLALLSYSNCNIKIKLFQSKHERLHLLKKPREFRILPTAEILSLMAQIKVIIYSLSIYLSSSGYTIPTCFVRSSQVWTIIIIPLWWLNFLAAIAALYLGSSLTDWLTHWLSPGAKLAQGYTTKGRPHIGSWWHHEDIKTSMTVTTMMMIMTTTTTTTRMTMTTTQTTVTTRVTQLWDLIETRGFRENIKDISNPLYVPVQLIIDLI